MHRMNPEHLDSDPFDLSLRADIRIREEPEDEEEEDEEEHGGTEEDEDGDQGPFVPISDYFAKALAPTF